MAFPKAPTTLAASAALLLTLITAAPANAASSDDDFLEEGAAANRAAALEIDPSTWDAGHSTAVLEVSGTLEGGDAARGVGVYNVVCTATADYVHKSEGAGGAIYKTRVSCSGTGLAAVTVWVWGGISFAPAPVDNGSAGPWTVRAESSDPQTVAVNGATATYYTPKEEDSGGLGTGYWTGTSTFQITAPASSNIATVQSLTWRSIS